MLPHSDSRTELVTDLSHQEVTRGPLQVRLSPNLRGSSTQPFVVPTVDQMSASEEFSGASSPNLGSQGLAADRRPDALPTTSLIRKIESDADCIA